MATPALYAGRPFRPVLPPRRRPGPGPADRKPP